MDKNEEDFLEAQYKIEKTGIKQQKLEERLSDLSKDLRKSKRNNLLFLVLFFILFGVIGVLGYLYIDSKDIKEKESKYVTNDIVTEEIQKMNDSLQTELEDLKTEIVNFRSELNSPTDTVGVNPDSVEVVSKSVKKVVVAVSEEETEDLPKGFEKRHCYIKRVYRRDDVVFVEADYINYFEGKNAVEKAKEDKKAEMDIAENGDTLYFLYENYYVQNKKSKIRILELDKSVRIEDVNQISTGFPLRAFEAILKKDPILVLEVKNGVVYKIKKQKIP